MSLLVAGSLHLDVVLRASHLPALDETVAGSSVDYVFGGKGGNQAISAARMGADVQFAGRVGSDAFGDMIRLTLGVSGIGLSQLQRDSGPSGMSAAILNASGDYGAVIVSAANLNISANDVIVPDGTELVVLQNEIPEAVNLEVALKAKAVGADVWLNAAPARALPKRFVEALDLMIVNRVEAEFYSSAGFDVDILTTLGADGVSYGGKQYPGFSVEVVSTHGAGDMFVGALASRFLMGAQIKDTIRFAQAAAALHVASPLEQRKDLKSDTVNAFLMSQDRR